MGLDLGAFGLFGVGFRFFRVGFGLYGVGFVLFGVGSGWIWGGIWGLHSALTHGGKQCAALSIHWGVMRAPPHTWLPWKETLLCHGH